MADATQARLARMIEQADRDARTLHPDDERAARRAADVFIAAYARGLTSAVRRAKAAA